MFTTRKSLRNIKTLTDLKNKTKLEKQNPIFQMIRLRDERKAVLQKLDILNSQEKEILSKKAMK
jgi:Trp operon repressor